MRGSALCFRGLQTAPETDEDQDSLEGNAKKKAKEISEYSGLPAIADDTGLFVFHLDGRPGVHTSRYAGPDADDEANVSKLLSELADAQDRSAVFRTVVAVVWPSGESIAVQGEVQGLITADRQGGSGFGYDPVFAPIEAFQGTTAVTFAQMTKPQKNAISHRGRAMAALRNTLEAQTAC